MKPPDMDRLIEIHLAAEKAADTAGAVSVYTDDVEHDVVGAPGGAVHGKGAAQGFYDHLTKEIHTEEMKPTHSYYGEDFCVVEHMWTGTCPGASSASLATAGAYPTGCCMSGSSATAGSAVKTSGSTAAAS